MNAVDECVTILITGATGAYGRLVIEHLLHRDVPADEIIAAVRTPAKADDLAARGIRIARLDYDDPASIAPAVADVDRVLLVSGSGDAVGRRIAQHQAVIDAVLASGTATRFGYTSITQADTSASPLAPEHRATEEALAASALPAVVFRNNWYTENEAPLVRQGAATGEIAGSAGDGRIASALRSEYAEAAAILMTQDAAPDAVYELGGDAAWSFDELAAAIAEVAGRDVVYRRVTPDEQSAEPAAAGVDPGMAGFAVAMDASYSNGDLAFTDGTLARVLGRPTASLVDGLRPLL